MIGDQFWEPLNIGRMRKSTAMKTYNSQAQKMNSCIFPGRGDSLNNEKYFFGYSRTEN